MAVITTCTILSCQVFAQRPAQNFAQRPIEDIGQSEAYSVAGSEDYPGLYEVRLTGQEDVPVYVNESTLRLVLESPAPTDVKATLISQYPYRMMELYDQIIEKNYPDDADKYMNETYEAWEFGGVSFSQDPYAPNYVRVSLMTEDGKVEEFSLSKGALDSILDVELTEENFSAALRKYPYRMPENARYAYNNLTREEFLAMVAEVPAVARQEFAQIRRVYTTPSPKNEGQRRESTVPLPQTYESVPKQDPVAVAEEKVVKASEKVDETTPGNSRDESIEKDDKDERAGTLPFISGLALVVLLAGVFIYRRKK